MLGDKSEEYILLNAPVERVQRQGTDLRFVFAVRTAREEEFDEVGYDGGEEGYFLRRGLRNT